MDMNWKNIKDIIEYSKNGILSKVVLKSPKLDVTLFCMAQKTEISEHTTTKEGFVYVIEGKGIFNLAGEDIVMMPGVFIPLGKNMKHSLSAQENTSFMLVLHSA